MDYSKMYEQKKVSVEEAASLIESSDRCYLGGIDATPRSFIKALMKRYEELEDVFLYEQLAVAPLSFLAEKYKGHFHYQTPYFGPADREAAKQRYIDLYVVAFCHFGRHILDKKSGSPSFNAMSIVVSEMDEDGYFYLGMQGTVCGGPVAEICDKVILQVNKNQPKISGEYNRIHIDQVTCLFEQDDPLMLLPDQKVTEEEKKIAENILPLIPDGATVQLGIGGVSNAVGYGLIDRKNLSIHTEMLTDSMRVLYEKGAISGEIWASFAWGGQELVEFVRSGIPKFRPLWMMNNPQKVAEYDNFVSINTSMMSDLTGQVCCEGIGHRQYSAIGGQLDYVRGAGMSKNGKSFLCFPATGKNKDGSLRSNIVLSFLPGQVVDVQRSDVMYIVTEFGIADLFNRSIVQRVNAMISIAHPEFREPLREEAIKAGLLPA